MKVRWFTNACLSVESKSGTRVLCDPWFTPGAFLGSWFQWPPVDPEVPRGILETKWDAIYITHLHPDHFDRVFLSKCIRAHPTTPIVVAKYAHPWLRSAVARLAGGSHKVVELDSFEVIAIGDIGLRVVVTDVCDPRICGVSIPCVPQGWRRGIDSVGIFTADGKTFCNANDGLMVAYIPRLAKAIGSVDLLMGHYGGAGPFPQCFPDVEDKAAAGQSLVESACSKLAAAADALDAQLLMPFAGQYILGGHLSGLNDTRAVVSLDRAVDILRPKTRAEVFSVEPLGHIDLNSGEKSCDYVEPDRSVLSEYLDSISGAVFPYDRSADIDETELEENLVRAARGITLRMQAIETNHDCSFIIGDGTRAVTVNFEGDLHSVLLGEDATTSNVTWIKMPTNLLWHLTRRKAGYKGFTSAHWNQAEVGSHFVWKRSGEYDGGAHALLNFFGA